MRTNFLLILGLCAGSLQQTVVCVAHGVCYEKDEVDLDVLYDDECVDVEGNIYDLGSELNSCCDCFSYKCEEIAYWGKQMKVGWVRSVSERCCQAFNGTVVPPGTLISSTQLEDDCLTTQTEICRVRPSLKTAVIELEFSYRNCCNDNHKTLHPLGSSVADPKTCSSRICSYEESWPQSAWLTEKVEEGCDCCLLPNGTMVADGATWWDTSVWPPLMLECCRGQIVTPAKPQPNCGDYAILLTGGNHGGDEVTTEVFIPAPSCPVKHCQLPDVAESQRYGHTQDGFMVCGGVGHQYDCNTYNPASGSWQETWNWQTPPTPSTSPSPPPRTHHVSWVGPGGVYLGGGEGEVLSSTWLDNLSGNVYFFQPPVTNIVNPILHSCSIQFHNFVIVIGGQDDDPSSSSSGTQVVKYYDDGSPPVVLPSLLIPRKKHSCGSYVQDAKEMLIVVAGETTSFAGTDTVEIFDLTSPASAWVTTTPFPFLISGSRGVTLDNIFYVTGGTLVNAWNPGTETWTEVAELCRGRVVSWSLCSSHY